MFAMQRSEKIMEILYKKEQVQVNELVKILNVSDVTIRKDLNKLAKQGAVIKTHGGAILKKSTPVHNNTIVEESTSSIHRKKDVLAKRTWEHIKDGDTIFLGSGYTCVSLAKQIPDNCDISVITNNIEAIPYLKGKCNTLILIGGEVITHESNFFTYTSDIAEQLKSYNINKAITSCSGIDLNFGVSFSTEASKKIISAILKNSQIWYLIADSSKFNLVSPYKIADIETPEMIITDTQFEEYKDLKNIVKY
jgi:DeoR family fructose operon transcriptional repressor